MDMHGKLAASWNHVMYIKYHTYEGRLCERGWERYHCQ